MKITQTGSYKENSLDKKIAVNPQDRVENILLVSLNFFLAFLSQNRPDIISDYVAHLTKKLEGLVKDDHWGRLHSQVQALLQSYDLLPAHSELTQAAFNYFVELLGATDSAVWEVDNTEVTMQALVQAWVFPPYYYLKALTELIPREQAVKLYKHLITQFYMEHTQPMADFSDLPDLVERRLSGDTAASDWVIVHTLLDEGKYAFKNKNCPTCVDAMNAIPDRELKYLVCCYGDYAKFRASYGDHIILTMEHTLMEGDGYCSRVLHDTRLDYDLRHPPKKFWDNLEPGKEETAQKILKEWRDQN